MATSSHAEFERRRMRVSDKRLYRSPTFPLVKYKGQLNPADFKNTAKQADVDVCLGESVSNPVGVAVMQEHVPLRHQVDRHGFSDNVCPSFKGDFRVPRGRRPNNPAVHLQCSDGNEHPDVRDCPETVSNNPNGSKEQGSIYCPTLQPRTHDQSTVVRIEQPNISSRLDDIYRSIRCLRTGMIGLTVWMVGTFVVYLALWFL